MKEKISKMLESYEFKDLYSYYEGETFFDILRVERKEDAHSNFLRWLFDNKSKHNLEDYPIRKLLELCNKNLSKDTQELIKLGNYNINNLEVIREKPIDKAGYLDLFINFEFSYDDNQKKKRFNIIIENKIESEEGENQTLKYQTWYEKSEYKNEEVLMLYFKPNIDEKLSSNKFVKVSYTDLCNKVLYCCEEKLKNINTKEKNILSDYICCISKPKLTTTGKDIIDPSLAINNNLKEKVKTLLNKYDDELTYIIDYLSNDSYNAINEHNIIDDKYNLTFMGIFYLMKNILDKEKDKKQISKIEKIISPRIEFYFNGEIYKKYDRNGKNLGNLAYDVINKYVEDNSATYDKLTEELDSLDLQVPWWNNPVLVEVPKKLEEKYKMKEPINLNDCKIYVAKCWIESDVLVLSKQLLKREPNKSSNKIYL